MSSLKDQTILLGVTGGISAYKAVEFARLLIQQGAQVRVIMTAHATQFITPLTFEAITQHPVRLHSFEEAQVMYHIDSARQADRIVVIPATASFIARLAHGFADDLLSATCLASQAPITIVPAMNKHMWSNAATQANLDILRSRHIQVLPTQFGEQACGEIGYGRMLEPVEVLSHLEQALLHPTEQGLRASSVPVSWDVWPDLLKGKNVLITVGATREPIDPVRYISNASSGKMGFSLGRAFSQLGARVTLICGHYEAIPPLGCERVIVRTAQEMLSEVLARVEEIDVFVGAAAVSDYRVETVSAQKIKSDLSEKTLRLVKNPDIITQIASLEKRPFVVGFALETENLIPYARKKLKDKKLDMVIANLCRHHEPLGSDYNEVTLLTAHNEDVISLSRADKDTLALQVAQKVSEFLSL